MLYFIIFVICITLGYHIIYNIIENKKYNYICETALELTECLTILENNKRYQIYAKGLGSLTTNEKGCYCIEYKAPIVFDIKNMLLRNEKSLYYITEDKVNFESFVKLIKKNELYKILKEKESKGKYIVKYKYK